MTVLVDTSVWIDFVNGHPSTQAERLAALIVNHQELATCGLIGAVGGQQVVPLAGGLRGIVAPNER